MKQNRIVAAILITFIATIILTNKVSAESCNVVHKDFPCEAKGTTNGRSKSINSEIGKVLKKQMTISGKTYKANCTMYNHEAPNNKTCKAVNWSSNATKNKKIAAAVGAIIKKGKDLDSSWEGAFFINAAMHEFLLANVTSNTYIDSPKRRYPNTYSKTIEPNNVRKKSLAAGNAVYKNFNKNKVIISNPTITLNHNNSSNKTTQITTSFKVTCKNDSGDIVKCNLASIEQELKVNGNKVKPNTKTVDKSKTPTYKYTYKDSNGFNNSTTQNVKAVAKFTVKNSTQYTVAQKYDCGKNNKGETYQGLVPFLLKTINEKKSDSASKTITIKHLTPPTTPPTTTPPTGTCHFIVTRVNNNYVENISKRVTLYKGYDCDETAEKFTTEIDSTGKAVFGEKELGHYSFKPTPLPTDSNFEYDNGDCQNITITNEENCAGEIRVSKKSCENFIVNSKEEETPIGNTKVELYSGATCSGDPISSLTTSAENGKAEFGEIEYGDYSIKLISPPSEYKFNGNSNCIHKQISSDNDCSADIRVQKQTGTLTIVKKDSDGKALAGAKIKVYKVVENKSNTSDTSDETGEETVELSDIDIANDSTDKTPEEGTEEDSTQQIGEFNREYLYFDNDGNYCGAKSDTCANDYFITNGQDKAITGLTPGETYYVEEEEVLEKIEKDGKITYQKFSDDDEKDDYTLIMGAQAVKIEYEKTNDSDENESNDSYFTITYDDNTHLKPRLTITNHHSNIYICKVDAKNKKGLAGAHLRIINNSPDQEQGEYADWTTQVSNYNPYGCAHITKLPDGDYYVEETTAPSGYTISNPITFTVKDGKLANNDDNILIVNNQHKITVPNTLANNPLLTLTGILVSAGGAGTIEYMMRKNKPVKQSD